MTMRRGRGVERSKASFAKTSPRHSIGPSLPMTDFERTIGFRSTRLRQLGSEIEQLSGFRPVPLRAIGRTQVAAFAGWGLEPASRRLRSLAEKTGRPYFTFEEGLVAYPTPRPAGLPLAMIVDGGGIYYDAASNSDFFGLLADPRWTSTDMRARAMAGISFLIENKLTRYNIIEPKDASRLPAGRALVVDQAVDDGSIRAGAANANDFSIMLNAAIEAHGAANVVVKLDRSSVAGAQQGHLEEIARMRGLSIVDWPVNSWRTIEPYDDIYVAASNLGFDALCLGKRVHCFGLPFYSGLGLTTDARPHVARRPSVSLQALFAAFYFGYTRFFSPYGRGIVPFEEGVATIADLARRYAEFAEPAIGFGISGWKRPTLSHFLAGSPVPPIYRRQFGRRPPQARYGERRTYVWASKIDIGRLADKAPDQRPIVVEDGFVRSVGLGAAGTAPLSLVFDKIGIYFDTTRESELERILRSTEFPPDLLGRAESLRERIVAGRISKYNVGAHIGLDPALKSRRVILAPGQVENDMSIRFGCDTIRTNLELLRAARDAAPDAFIIYKPHPDVENGYRRGTVAPKMAMKFADLIVNNTSVVDLFEVIDEIHTMTSLAGFEALLRGRRVVTYGGPFYAGWGLTEDRMRFARRDRILTLDQLVAGALILYPRYLHPRSGYLCGPEHVLDELVAQVERVSHPSGMLNRILIAARKLILPWIS